MRAAMGVILLLLLSGCGSPPAEGPVEAESLPCRDSAKSPAGSQARGGNVSLIVMVENGIDTAPIPGANVSVLLDDGDVDFDLYSQGPYWNRCTVAYAIADEAGMAILEVVGGHDYFIAAGDDERWFPDEPWTQEFAPVRVDQDTVAWLQLYPRHIRYVWNGSIAGIDPDGSQTFEARDTPTFGGSFPSVLERAYVPAFTSTLDWTNTAVWGDLYLGLAVGDEERHTSETGNEAQDRNDGFHQETLLSDFNLMASRRCDVVTEGLSLVVFDPGPLEAPGAEGVAGLPFTYTLDLELRGLNRGDACP